MATYREVFAVREFRALFAAHLLSQLGDQLSKVAISVLVFETTDSALFAAVAFGVSYLPWVVIGPVLTTLADRFPRRSVMITCDLARATLIAMLAVPGLPVGMEVAGLFAASLFAPPAQAARSATMPEVLPGDAYVVANGVSAVTGQLAQVIGFAGGGLLVGVLSPRGALLADAATFALSAALLSVFLARRRPTDRSGKTTLLQDTAGGLRLVMTDRRLRAYVILAWIGAAFTAAPEGLMTAYASHLQGGATMTGILLAAMPAGTVCGAIVYGRFTRPARRWRLLPAMALLSCASLLPVLADPPLLVSLGFLAAAGYGSAHQVALNARFVRDVPPSHRGRAFGVAVAGMMVAMGGATAIAGAMADVWRDPPMIIGLCGLAGVVTMLPVLARWPHEQDLSPTPARPPSPRADAARSPRTRAG
ncbi:MFS transporter [Nonomuraea turcica]|uniref:MFS transporter n=1 Tax=Nonomuraea sp. G32 TaxID=3067274 RepID=UPI00273A75D3|nr:MFS transporter [Nonomuraea sp. G32]MDP4511530.1 MFS transporter [Nonomuraea sp. G32]